MRLLLCFLAQFKHPLPLPQHRHAIEDPLGPDRFVPRLILRGPARVVDVDLIAPEARTSGGIPLRASARTSTSPHPGWRGSPGQMAVSSTPTQV